MIRFNHIEVTVPIGFVAEHGADVVNFFAGCLGFRHSAFPGMAEPHLIFTTDEQGSQFIYIAEHATPAAQAADDHLGLHLDSTSIVESTLELLRDWQSRDPRIEIRDFGTLDLEQTSTRAFYVRFLLPIWFDVQHIAAKPGFEPRLTWQYLPAPEVRRA